MSTSSGELASLIPPGIDVEEVVKAIYLNEPHSFSSRLLEQLSNSHKLENSSTHKEESLLSLLRSRLQTGLPYTLAGSLLLAFNSSLSPSLYLNRQMRELYSSESEDLPPHIFTVSKAAFNKMKSSHSNQAIALLGSCGSGKTFTVIHIIDHLIWISSTDYVSQKLNTQDELFHLMHEGFQALHIMVSVSKMHNIESTTGGISLALKFDSDFRAVGGELKGSPLNLFMSKGQRTYQLLHSMMYAGKDFLQRLGLPAEWQILGKTESLSVLDWQVWNRFNECMDNMKIDTTKFYELISAVILLFEMQFGKKSTWRIRNRVIVQKITRVLGCSENHFWDSFENTSGVDRAEDMAKHLYETAFEWLCHEINQKLKQLSNEIVEKRWLTFTKFFGEQHKNIKKVLRAKYSISIIDFPGFSREQTLGNLCTNLAVESLNYYCCNDYIRLLAHLKQEKIKVKMLKPPRSKFLVEFFLAKDTGLLNKFGDSNLSQVLIDYEKELKDKEISNLIQIQQNTLSVNFSWGSVSYNIDSLQEESFAQLGKGSYILFAKHCSNEILRATYKSIHSKFHNFRGNRLSLHISKLIQPTVKISPHMIYCIRAEKNRLPNSTVFLLRNSLVLPTLVWSWYGYQHWLTAEDLVNEFSLLLGSQKQGSLAEQARKILTEHTSYTKIIVTRRYILLNDEHIKSLKTALEQANQELNYSESESDSISMITPFASKKNIENFGFNVYTDNFETHSVITEHEAMDNSFEEMTVKEETSDASLDKLSLLMIGSNSSYESGEYWRVDYTSRLPAIITIQSIFRGIKARKQYRIVKELSGKSVVIQKHWRGYKARKAVNPMIKFTKAIRFIQEIWKIKFQLKKTAAMVIGSWFKTVLKHRKKVKFATEKQVLEQAIIENQTKEKSVRTERLSIFERSFRSSYAPPSEAESNRRDSIFTPTLSMTSKKLASRRNLGKLPLEERFKLLEAKRQQEIHRMRQKKAEEERKNLTHTPTIKRNIYVGGTFLERQEQFSVNTSTKKNQMIAEKEEQESLSFTFSPDLKSKNRTNRSIDRLRNRFK